VERRYQRSLNSHSPCAKAQVISLCTIGAAGGTTGSSTAQRPGAVRGEYQNDSNQKNNRKDRPTTMPTKTTPEFVIVPDEARRVIRETRALLGLSRETLEQRAKVGMDYVKKLELGQRPSADATRLRRVLQVVQQAAARRQVPAKLAARIDRVVKAVAKPGQRTAARSGLSS
jgi:ribosome-binding protein aMBF1 (putative translation factor)